jgi:hypothetical protein
VWRHKYVTGPIRPETFYRSKRRAQLKLAEPLLSSAQRERRMDVEWYFMSEEQRAPFRALSEADKLRFLREVEAYGAAVTAKSAKGS